MCTEVQEEEKEEMVQCSQVRLISLPLLFSSYPLHTSASLRSPSSSLNRIRRIRQGSGFQNDSMSVFLRKPARVNPRPLGCLCMTAAEKRRVCEREKESGSGKKEAGARGRERKRGWICVFAQKTGSTHSLFSSFSLFLFRALLRARMPEEWEKQQLPRPKTPKSLPFWRRRVRHPPRAGTLLHFMPAWVWSNGRFRSALT